MNSVTTNLNIYMDSAGTQSILLKPVLRKITRSIDDIRKLIDQVPDGDLEWVAEKRVSAIGLIDAINELLTKKTSKP